MLTTVVEILVQLIILLMDECCVLIICILISLQIKQLNEPIEVRISEWNTGGLLTRIEVCFCFVFFCFFNHPVIWSIRLWSRILLTSFQGLRAFLPKAELMGRVNTFTDLKENVSYNSLMALFYYHVTQFLGRITWLQGLKKFARGNKAFVQVKLGQLVLSLVVSY